jgi:hypothetical protein
VLGNEHLFTLMSMSNLANILGDQGKYEEAEEMHRQTIRLSETNLERRVETRSRLLGHRHPDALTAMANLAHTWKSRGQD